MRPFFRANLPRVTERIDRKSDRLQFHTESQNVRQPYNVLTISSRHMQGRRKTVMQNLQDCHKTKKYVVPFPLCNRAVIVRFSVVVVRFAAFLWQPCYKAHGHLAIVLRVWRNITSVVRTPCVSCSSLAAASRVLRLSYVSQKTHTNRKENEHVENLFFDVAAALRPCLS